MMLKIINIDDSFGAKGSIDRKNAADRESGLETITSRLSRALSAFFLRSHSSARCKYTNNDCIITRIKSIILMCELHVEAHTKPCRTFNKITPRFEV